MKSDVIRNEVKVIQVSFFVSIVTKGSNHSSQNMDITIIYSPLYFVHDLLEYLEFILESK